jgi:uncharacterized membrane protein
MKIAIIALAGAGLMVTACASDPYGSGYGQNQAVRQGASGAAIGAAAGQVLGGDTEATLAGAAIGGAIGAIRGSSQDRGNQQRYYDNARRSYYYCYDGRQTECYWEDGSRRY